MKYLHYSTISMPCETNIEKAKSEFAFLGEPVEYNKIYNFPYFSERRYFVYFSIITIINNNIIYNSKFKNSE